VPERRREAGVWRTPRLVDGKIDFVPEEAG
jgi:hypothetical protein